MVAHVNTIAFHGITPKNVDVQVHIASGNMYKFNIVGLPDKAVGESKDRVRSAMGSLGCDFTRISCRRYALFGRWFNS